MEYLLGCDEMREADRVTTEKIGIPALVLMERAALSVAEEVRKLRTQDKICKVLIAAGCGNNGADGLALARLLCQEDFFVEVVICQEEAKATEQWKKQFEILKHFPVKTGRKLSDSEYDIIIDAVFGVGLSREIRDGQKEIIRQLNCMSGYKIAVDMPSGISSDTGQILGCAFRADLTVCFAFGKKGLYFYPGCEYAGRVAVKDIGIGPLSLEGKTPGMFRYTEPAEELLPKREASGNKGTFGKVMIAAGNRNMAGAAILAARGCCHAGAGMVKVMTRECNRVILQCSVPEALLSIYPEDENTDKQVTYDSWPDILLAGPGLGTDTWARNVMKSMLVDYVQPLVIDADGLNLISACPDLEEILKTQIKEGRKVVMTPHVGELSRLIGCSIPQIKKDPETAAMSAAEKFGCTVVCKDARTLTVKKQNPICMNTTGNNGMATAGSGDVLAGIIAGIMAQKEDEFEAACIGVYLHGIAGDRAASKYGVCALTSARLADEVAIPMHQKSDV